jgi:hypothetical protein
VTLNEEIDALPEMFAVAPRAQDPDPTSYAVLAPEQKDELARVVAERRVIDLGAGNMALSIEMIEMGAAHVTALDYVESRHPRALAFASRLSVIRSVFHDVVDDLETADIAMLSWPQNTTHDALEIVQILRKHPRVAVISKNTDGVSCGCTLIYEYLATRELLAYHPRRANTLMVYGAPCAPRLMVGEERAGMAPRSLHKPIIRYEELNEALS